MDIRDRDHTYIIPRITRITRITLTIPPQPTMVRGAYLKFHQPDNLKLCPLISTVTIEDPGYPILLHASCVSHPLDDSRSILLFFCFLCLFQTISLFIHTIIENTL